MKEQDELKGIVQRITYHNPDNGWSVLRVQPFDQRREPVTVVVHQTRVFAGATMRFRGEWAEHPRFGRQFKATEALEIKPATAAALEKYLGSGLIRGVGPKTAKKIVSHFGDQTLEVFEGEIVRLTEVPGIAAGKLKSISAAWQEHRAIREVMLFLQGQGISTLFAVRIYKEYGDQAVAVVSADPYRLAEDIYGIGFFSADRVALGLGFAADGDPRLMAAIRHVLAAGREEGHCYLTLAQVDQGVRELLELDPGARIAGLLARMEAAGKLMVRLLPDEQGAPRPCYYSKTIYFEEQTVAARIRALLAPVAVDANRLEAWLDRHCRGQELELSPEQRQAVAGIAGRRFAILTGGPGCGKTTTTKVLVRLLEAMSKKVLLAAPTGRAAQRLGEVVGREARTIHRLLEWQATGFKRRAEHPLECDFLIVDECSMLDVSLAAALLQALPPAGQLLMIGDPDQLPPVGAGNVLRDLIASGMTPCFRLRKVFRQAAASAIIRFAHQINEGEIPRIDSPFRHPERWQDGSDCLFIDSDEATQEQLHFLHRVRQHFAAQPAGFALSDPEADPYQFRLQEAVIPYETELSVPAKFRHVDLAQLRRAETRVEELKTILRRVHPWSSLNYGLAAVEVVKKLYREWIPKYRGKGTEIQVLTPMTRGSLGTRNLNAVLQAEVNPAGPGRPEIQVGDRLFRQGDRVIHTRNNYDLGVFNGDIGVIAAIDHESQACAVAFPPDASKNRGHDVSGHGVPQVAASGTAMRTPVREPARSPQDAVPRDRLPPDQRRVLYRRDQLPELELAYAITIHKSQGSEFAAVIIPVLTQHYRMLFRNLIYTGLTRARQLAVLVGSRRALALAVSNQDTSIRQTALVQLLREDKN